MSTLDIPFKRSHKIAGILSLVLINALPNFVKIPFPIQLFISSVSCVVLGFNFNLRAIMSVRFRERIGLDKKDEDN